MSEFEQMVMRDAMEWAAKTGQTFRTEQSLYEAFWAEKLSNAGKRPLVAI